MSTFLKRHQKAVIWAVIVSFVLRAGGLITLTAPESVDQLAIRLGFEPAEVRRYRRWHDDRS